MYRILFFIISLLFSFSSIAQNLSGTYFQTDGFYYIAYKFYGKDSFSYEESTDVSYGNSGKGIYQYKSKKLYLYFNKYATPAEQHIFMVETTPCLEDSCTIIFFGYDKTDSIYTGSVLRPNHNEHHRLIETDSAFIIRIPRQSNKDIDYTISTLASSDIQLVLEGDKIGRAHV